MLISADMWPVCGCRCPLGRKSLITAPRWLSWQVDNGFIVLGSVGRLEKSWTERGAETTELGVLYRLERWQSTRLWRSLLRLLRSASGKQEACLKGDRKCLGASLPV